MISCTEFVPLYSDFFTYLDDFGGHAEVEKYWAYVSEHRLGDKNNPLALISFLEREDDPFVGARKYWGHTLKEEKTDKESLVDLERGFSYSHMRRCPSKGKLIECKHITPYYDYCGHCEAIFRPLLARYGLGYEMDLTDCAKAECRSLLYRLGDRPSEDELADDGKMQYDEMKAEDNEYYHPGFHISCDIALRYCGELFGDEGVRAFLAKHTRNYYAPVIERVREGGVPALVEWIREYYAVERMADAVTVEELADGVRISAHRDPALEFMKQMNHTPCRNHAERTRTVLATVCEDCGLEFEMQALGEDGSCSYTVKERRK